MKEIENQSSKTQEFVKRLKKELPQWIAKGWVNPNYKSDILNSVQDKESFETKTSIVIFSLLGIILLSVGVLLFIAAHWETLPKIVKLLLMFGSMWGAYVCAGFFFKYKEDNPYFNTLGHLFLLFGVCLFGANIWLIAQIYHISAHFPNGVLIWSLGAWWVALCLHNQPSLFVSILLAAIWSYTESEFFWQTIHWPFLILVALNGWVILKEKWVFKEKWESPLDFLLFVVVAWLIFNFVWIRWEHYTFYFNICILVSFIILMLSIPLLNMITPSAQIKPFGINKVNQYLNDLNQSPTVIALKSSLQHYSIFYLLLLLFGLTFPDVLKHIGLASERLLPITLLLIVFSALAYLYFWKNETINTLVKTSGAVVFSALGVLLILNHLWDHPSFMAIFFNVVFLSILLWCIVFGHEKADKIYINIAFFYFAILVIARYFDVFWGLLNRSLFFVVGGLILLIGSILIEKKRRKYTQTLKAPSLKVPSKSSLPKTKD